MKKKELIDKLALLGFPLFDIEEGINGAEILNEVIETGDSRFWEAFPLLLASSFEKGLLTIDDINIHFKTKGNKEDFQKLVMMSYALYKYLKLDLSWIDDLKNISFFDMAIFDQFIKNFNENGNILLNSRALSSERVLNTFKRYFKKQNSDLKRYSQMREDFDLEYSLSQLFSKKQKELVLKKFRNEKMTKTEREYFSRIVRKKIMALANSDLHELALKLARE